jgi:phage recombination protein Bet
METNQVTTTKPGNIIAFSDDQVSLIKRQIAPKATDDELKLFLYQAQRTGLDPMTRQIYCIHRYDKNVGQKMTIQTAIDGFRVIAERSGNYAGQDEPEFIEDEKGIVCCKVRVYKFRGDQRYQASVGVAYWSEYVPQAGQDYMWKKMPHTMISKVAEALALRKAYPQDLSGLYTNDEMQQADAPHPTIDQELTDPNESVDSLHKEYMEQLNILISIQGIDANKYHPDNWKKDRNISNYKKALVEIVKMVKSLEAQPA